MVDALRCPPRAKSPLRIVVVDDDEVVTGVVAAILHRAGYEPVVTCSSEEALRFVRERPPALLIADVRMPELDGFDLCTMLKDHPRTRRVPIIFLSGLTSEHNHTLGQLFGAAAYMDKPFSAQALLQKVQQVLEGPNAGAGP